MFTTLVTNEGRRADGQPDGKHSNNEVKRPVTSKRKVIVKHNVSKWFKIHDNSIDPVVLQINWGPLDLLRLPPPQKKNNTTYIRLQ